MKFNPVLPLAAESDAGIPFVVKLKVPKGSISLGGRRKAFAKCQHTARLQVAKANALVSLA
jgi:hypothetical protein